MLGTVLRLGHKVMNEYTVKAGSLLLWSLHSYRHDIDNEQINRENTSL